MFNMKISNIISITILPLVIVLYTKNVFSSEIGGIFALENYDGQIYDLAKSNNKKLIFFGFTNCPDICPTALTEMSTLLNQLGGMATGIDVIFITVDPKRDTIKQLKDYITFFDERIYGLTGSMEEIDKITNQYHIYYSYTDKKSENEYTVNHTANLYLLDKGNSIVKIFPPGTPFNELSNSVHNFLKK